MKKRLALVIVICLLGLANMIRAATAFYVHAMLEAPNLPWLPILGGFYASTGLIFCGLAVLCWRRDRNCRAFAVVLVYEIISWILRLVTYRASYARSVWLRDAAITLVFLGLIYSLSRRKRPRTRNQT